jgi:hypothetical protein
MAALVGQVLVHKHDDKVETKVTYGDRAEVTAMGFSDSERHHQ